MRILDLFGGKNTSEPLLPPLHNLAVVRVRAVAMAKARARARGVVMA
jgi:hypothetical protein